MRSISLGLAAGLASLISSLTFQPTVKAEVVIVPTNTSGGLITSSNPSLGFAPLVLTTLPPTDGLLSAVIQEQPITLAPEPLPLPPVEVIPEPEPEPIPQPRAIPPRRLLY